MRSSTSNSEQPAAHQAAGAQPGERAPAKRWTMIWGISLLLAMAVVAGVEWQLRSAGLVTSVRDSPARWARFRARVSDDSVEHVVLLGASRMQLGFSMETFQQRFPDRPLTLLAISGSAAGAVLFDLAEDKDFCGVVICSITADGFMADKWTAQEEYVQTYHQSLALPFVIEPHVSTYMQNHFVVFGEQWRPKQFLNPYLHDGSVPSPYYVVSLPDRSRKADYSIVDRENYVEQRIKQRSRILKMDRPTPERWMDDVRVVETAVQKIQSRGGRVVFVRFPTGGEHWKIDEQAFPKDQYWDRMAEFTSAETIHFADVPGMSGFDLPDTSHLDYRDAPAFTNALLDELERRGVL